MEQKYKYYIAQPDLRGNEQKYLKEAIDTGWISSKGPFVERLEQKWADFIGTRYAVACSSGTAALMLSLAALGVKEGDEVIVPEFTMVATAWAVTYLGAKPVFVDCGDDLNIDVELIEKAITKKTKAIIPVHIYGRACNMKRIMEIVKQHNLKVVEDVCEAHGGSFEKTKLGAWGDIGCFSLFANKIISSGEGGIITTNDKKIYEELVLLRSMAFSKEHNFLHPKLGYCLRLSNIQAAVALAQAERIEEFLEKRQQILNWYDAELGNITIKRPEGSVLWVYDVFPTEGLLKKAKMERSGIETRYLFKPMSMQPMYYKQVISIIGDYAIDGYKTLKAYNFSLKGFYLPVYTQLTKENIKEICSYMYK